MPCCRRRLSVTLGLALLVTSEACAHKPATPVDADELQRTVASLRTQNAAYLKQIEELENQVFILSDQIDSRKVSADRVAEPRLPQVRLHPSLGTPADEPGVVVSEDDPGVEYAGEAARTSTRRPVLRLVGSDTRATSASLSEETPAPAPLDKEARPLFVAGERTHERRVAQAQPAQAPVVGGARAIESYRRSLDALQAGNHTDAAAGFREFLKRHPGHDYADNAQYWLAECYYDLKDYDSAAREFRRVVDNYPQGNKVPDALLKLAFAYLALGKDAAGQTTLSELVRSYPKHEAAARAEAKLADLKTGGAAAGGK